MYIYVYIYIYMQAAGDNLERCIKAVAALTRDLGTYAHVCSRMLTFAALTRVNAAYVSIRLHTSAYVPRSRVDAAYVSIRQHVTYADVCGVNARSSFSFYLLAYVSM